MKLLQFIMVKQKHLEMYYCYYSDNNTFVEKGSINQSINQGGSLEDRRMGFVIRGLLLSGRQPGQQAWHDEPHIPLATFVALEVVSVLHVFTQRSREVEKKKSTCVNGIIER